MNHDQLRQWVSFFIDHEATAEQRRTVLNHLESCSDCRSLVGEASTIRTGIQQSAHLDLPATFAYDVLRRVRVDRDGVENRAGADRLGLRVVFALSLVVVCLFGFGTLYQPELPAAPVDRILTGELPDSLSKRMLELQRDLSNDDIIFAAISK